MFERWADAVAAIPIDDGSKPATPAGPAIQAQGPSQPTSTQSGPAPLKIDVVDHLDHPSAKELGLRAAITAVDSELAGLRRQIAPDGPIKTSAPVTDEGQAHLPGAFMAQLAAFPNREAAESGWAKMQTEHGKLLAHVSARFDSVDLGGRGVWTRVEAGPFQTRDAAAAVCTGLGVADRWCVTGRRD